MTYKEKLKIEHPEKVNDIHVGGCIGCPNNYYDAPEPESCSFGNVTEDCVKCWDREIPEEKSDVQKAWETIKECCTSDAYVPNGVREVVGVPPHILDSGNRREFETGAVRDIQEGKGRCDLMPLDVVGHALSNPTLSYIYKFQLYNNVNYLYDALSSCGIFHDCYTLMLEVAKHFEEGAKKYGENNWQKGIPTHCYIDSAVRHYLKFLRGDKDEPHDRAFVWNILCCIWTCKHKPELNDYADRNGVAE